MSYGKLSGHIEALIPGLIVVSWIGYSLDNETAKEILDHPFVAEVLLQPIISGFLLLSLAYFVGVFTFVLSRMVIDIPSAYTLRPLLLKFSKRVDMSDLAWNEINNQYRIWIEAAIGPGLANEAIKMEVLKRRQRGRILRSSIVPGLMFVWSLTNSILALIGCFLFILLSYAYNELSIFQEATLRGIKLN